jgi:hypothetical protein
MLRIGELKIADEAQGTVEAIVGRVNVVDREGDVILPGAIPVDGAPVKISGYGHDMILDGLAPVGKGVVTEEPTGELLLRARFFLATSRGREAWTVLREMGPDQEWSIGFRGVETAELTPEWRAQGATRLIKRLELLEASPVLRAAGVGTGTLTVKTGERAAPEQAPPAARTDGREAVKALMTLIGTCATVIATGEGGTR